MPEYIYLLETRLSAAQKNALTQVRDAARETGLTVFLAGGAVRDLTTGSSVRDLDFSVQGNALSLQAAIEARGGKLWGKHEPSRTLFFWFPGSVRVEVVSTRSESFPKPGAPVYSWSGIVDDLNRRDFTANAMALSLNEGSYGLLLDPLNGVADIEARQLRLVSNYGFIEDPSRLIRAVRLRHRLGWQLEERTATRYENAKQDDNFSVISPFLRGYELEKIAAEDEALASLKALEAEGWMDKLAPGWTSASVDTVALEDLHRNRIQLLMQDVSPDLSAAHLEILTAKMAAKDRDKLKHMMVRPGLLAQWEGLDVAAKEFSRLLTGKEAATPSATWKLFHSHAAEPILWLAHTRKGAAVETKFKNFFSVWPEFAKKVPVALMLEMRITPELPVYDELLRELFLKQIDGNLETDEQMRAFLEKYSPPAPPPPVTLRRTRTKKTDSKSKRKEAARDEDDEDLDDDQPSKGGSDDDEDDDLDEDEDKPAKPEVEEISAGRKLNLDKIDLGAVLGRIQKAGDEDEVDLDEDDESDDDEKLVGKAGKAEPAKAGKGTPVSTKKSATAVAPLADTSAKNSANAVKTPAKSKAPVVAAVALAAKTLRTPVGDAKPAAKAAPTKPVSSKTAPVKSAPSKAVTSKVSSKVGSKTEPVKAQKAVPTKPAVALKKPVPTAKKAVPAKRAAPGHPVKAVAAKKIANTTPAKKAVAKVPSKSTVKPGKKAPVKATKPGKKR